MSSKKLSSFFLVKLVTFDEKLQIPFKGLILFRQAAVLQWIREAALQSRRPIQ